MTMRRLIDLKIITTNATILVRTAYLPYRSDDNIGEYQVI